MLGLGRAKLHEKLLSVDNDLLLECRLAQVTVRRLCDHTYGSVGTADANDKVRTVLGGYLA